MSLIVATYNILYRILSRAQSILPFFHHGRHRIPLSEDVHQTGSSSEFRSAEILDDDSLVAGNVFLGGERVENLEEAISVDVGSATDGCLVHPEKPNKDHRDICRLEYEENDRNELMR